MNNDFEYFDLLGNIPGATIDGLTNVDFEYFDVLGNVLSINFSSGEEPVTASPFGPLIQCI